MNWLFLAVAQAICPENVSLEMNDSIGAIEDALKLADEPAFDKGTVRLSDALKCLEEPIERALASRLHRTEALIFFSNGEEQSTSLAMAAAKWMDPNSPWTSQWFLEGHPFHTYWVEAAPTEATYYLGKMASRTWVVDGSKSDEAPADRAYVLQVMEEDGAISWTGYIVSSDQIPKKGQVYEDPKPKKPPQLGWLGVGLGTRFRQESQDAEDVGWTTREQSNLLPQIQLSASITPVRWYGASVSTTVLLRDKMLVEGVVSNSFRTRGGEENQRFLGLTIGAHISQQDTILTGQESLRSTFIGPLLGVDGGFESERFRSIIELQSRFISMSPKTLRLSLLHQRHVKGLGLGGEIFAAHQTVDYRDEQEQPAGRRRDLDLGLQFVVGAWL